MTRDKRDYSLDLLKGLACILMVFAHSDGVENSPLTAVLSGEHDRLTRLIYVAGQFAPVFFFAVSGIAGYRQAGKYGPRPVLASYVFLFLLGFSYNGITQRDFYHNPEMEILQIIAIGAFSVYLFQYVIKPAPVVFLAVGTVLFALKILSNQLILFTLNLSSNHSHWIGVLTDIGQGVIVPPGTFPVLPWLFLFFMGVFAYHTGDIYNLALAFVSIGSFVVLTWLSFPLQPSNKWDMSIGNFLLSCFLLFVSFYFVRKLDSLKRAIQEPLLRAWCIFFRSSGENGLRVWKSGNRLLLFWGTYSLLFLFVHKFVIRLLHRSALLDGLDSLLRTPLVFWLAVLVITSILMKLILQLSSRGSFSRIFEDIRAWLVLMCLVLLAPLLARNNTVLYGVELLLGIVFAIYYPFLRQAIKQPAESASRPDLVIT